ncbi:hypothetical protein I3760_05G029400 [Carya illinoinensis]|nr:hypothetical protein I3760_05G029400 [Carya illinoinensis]
MVCKDFRVKHFLFPKPPFIFYLSIIATCFLLIPFTSAISFNYTSFSSNDTNITYDQRAAAAKNVIRLTGNQAHNQFVGRVTYSRPMHLWDKISGNLTDFTTHFSFIIDSQNRTAYGDGLVFFLDRAGSKIPKSVTKGGAMGLTRDGQELNTTDNHFVAVEFDIYQNNRWDPPSLHVGIDIKSMRSIANVSWLISNTSIMEGRKNEAWISYNSSSHNLNVVFTALRNNVPVRQFLSEIVDLRLHLPEFVAFGFSAATGNAFAMHIIYSWDFSSSLETDDGIVTNPTGSGAPSRSKNKKLGLALGLGADGFVSVGGLALVLLALWKKSRRDQEDDLAFAIYMDEEFQKGTGPKRFSFKELVRATKNFSDEEKLGEGGFGGVYRGFLRDSNASVAMKRVSKASKQRIKEYASEIKIIGQLRHRNLVQLLGWCHEKRELLLVYEFLSNGSLDSFLFKDTSLLIWELRYKIAQGLASALLYLHEEWEQCVVHRDIKSSNIMLDSDFNAKLGDFGLARFVDHAKGSRTIALAGTMDTWLPNVGEVVEAADPRLWCANPDHNFRPSIREIIHVLNFEAPLPVLPSNIQPPVYPPRANRVNRPETFLYTSNAATNFEGWKSQHLSQSYHTNFSQLTSSSTSVSLSNVG